MGKCKLEKVKWEKVNCRLGCAYKRLAPSLLITMPSVSIDVPDMVATDVLTSII